MSDKRILGVTALYPVIAVANPNETALAFSAVLPINAVFESDWFVQLNSADNRMQLGLVRFDHTSVPEGWRQPVAGAFVTVDVEDVSAAWAQQGQNLDIVHPLTDEEWGQRHFIARLPGNVLVDFVQML